MLRSLTVYIELWYKHLLYNVVAYCRIYAYIVLAKGVAECQAKKTDITKVLNIASLKRYHEFLSARVSLFNI